MKDFLSVRCYTVYSQTKRAWYVQALFVRYMLFAVPYFFFFLADVAGFAFAFAMHSPFSIATRYAYNEFELNLGSCKQKL